MRALKRILTCIILAFLMSPVVCQEWLNILDTDASHEIRFAAVNENSSIVQSKNSISVLKEALKVGSNTDFDLYKIDKDKIDMTHEKYHQVFCGIPA